MEKATWVEKLVDEYSSRISLSSYEQSLPATSVDPDASDTGAYL